MIRWTPAVIALRVANAAYFLVTSIYYLLTYSPFTYQQFIKPHVSGALTGFALWHVDLFWLMLSATALTLAPHLDHRRARWVGWGYLAAMVPLGLWLVRHPLWAESGGSRASAVLAVVCACPPCVLGVFDHRTGDDALGFLASDNGRTSRTCFLTAVYVWAAYALAVPLRLRLTGGIDLSAGGLLLASIVSVIAHLTVFTLAFLALLAMSRVAAGAREAGRVEYRLIAGFSAVGIAAVLLRVVLTPIAIGGVLGPTVSLAIGVALATSWSGLVHRWLAERPDTQTAPMTALDAWFVPLRGRGGLLLPALGLVAAPLVAQVLIARVAAFDWEFMLQKLAALATWLVAFACVHALLRGRARREPLLWRGPIAVLVVFAASQIVLARVHGRVTDPRVDPEFALDGYASVDPSYRVVRDSVGARGRGESADFYAYLRAHSTIQQARLEPVNIEFARIEARAGARPAHVFLFIVDSLRRDYVSPYNPAVSFTPAIAAFAKESFVFSRAFSRYGGTGLAVPSIWAGSMLIHKQYVTPFAPMNALEKLVDGLGYQRFVTEDHITDELFAPSPATVGLDHAVPEMLHSFCRTLGELETRLGERVDDPRPMFVLTRPLDLHIGNVASATVPPGETYPGFHAPYAARVRRMDACFGRFIETLKRTGLYDNSIIVLTSDHGDSLGEGRRWGHGFTVYPEVLKIPLIIHVPPALGARVTTDLARVAFSTDITPTLYALLGQPPAIRKDNPLLGAPLFVPPTDDLAWRRRDAYLVASSYGAVYGLLNRNGRRLYIVDGIEGREYAYDLATDGLAGRIRVTDAERAADRQAIRRQIADLAAWYHFVPEP